MPSKTTARSFTQLTSVAQLLPSLECSFSTGWSDGRLPDADGVIRQRTGRGRTIPETIDDLARVSLAGSSMALPLVQGLPIGTALAVADKPSRVKCLASGWRCARALAANMPRVQNIFGMEAG